MGEEDIVKNQQCWTEGCAEKIEEWPLCKKHREMEDKDLKMSTPTSPKSVGKPGA